MILEWKHRWKRSYMKEWLKKFRAAIVWYKDLHFVHIVLTVPRKYSIDIYMRLLKIAWKALHDLLVKRHGRFDFISVLEPQRDGYPHLHVLVFCNYFLINQEELSKYMEKCCLGRIVFIKRYWANRWSKKPLYYLVKYLSKYFEEKEWNESLLVFFAHLWQTKTRSISSSHNFFDVMKKPKKEKEWELWFVCNYEDVYSILNEANVAVDNVLDYYNDGG